MQYGEQYVGSHVNGDRHGLIPVLFALITGTLINLNGLTIPPVSCSENVCLVC
jgi:hypothetical protein